MTSCQMHQNASAFLFRFTQRDRRPKNGMTKWPNSKTQEYVPQLFAKRSFHHNVSSGMFAYHCSMNCEKPMYAQKIVKAKTIFPRSWKWWTVTLEARRPLLCSHISVSASEELTASTQLAK